MCFCLLSVQVEDLCTAGLVRFLRVPRGAAGRAGTTWGGRAGAWGWAQGAVWGCEALTHTRLNMNPSSSPLLLYILITLITFLLLHSSPDTSSLVGIAALSLWSSPSFSRSLELCPLRCTHASARKVSREDRRERRNTRTATARRRRHSSRSSAKFIHKSTLAKTETTWRTRSTTWVRRRHALLAKMWFILISIHSNTFMLKLLLNINKDVIDRITHGGAEQKYCVTWNMFNSLHFKKITFPCCSSSGHRGQMWVTLSSLAVS